MPPSRSPITGELREQVRRHVGLLTGENHDVLLAAAVLGQRFTIEAIGSMCARPLRDVSRFIESEVAVGVLAEVSRRRGAFRFSVPGFREVLVEQLPPGRRRWLREKAGIV